MRTHSHRHIPKAAFISVGAAVLINVILFLLASVAGIINEDIIVEGDNAPITLWAVISATLIGAVLAIIVFAIMLKVFKDKAVIWYQRVGLVFLLLTLVAPLTITDPDADSFFYGALILMHIGAGLSMLWLLPKHTAELS